jgi:hypothetical protein
MIKHLSNGHQIIDPKKALACNKIDAATQTYYLLMFIISAALPFLCVNNEYFKKFVYSLNLEFKIPDRRTISDLANVYFLKKKEKLKEQIQKATDFSLTTDCWTSKQNFSYIFV